MYNIIADKIFGYKYLCLLMLCKGGLKMFCGHCGKQNPDNAKSCSNCGKQFDKTQFTRENTERIRLNNTQRIPKKEITQKIVMAVPPKPKRKNKTTLIVVGVVVLLFFLMIMTILSFKFLFGQDDKSRPMDMKNNNFSASSSDIDENNSDNSEVLTMNVEDWSKYDGNWSAGGYEFSFETDGNKFKCTMRTKDNSWNTKANITDGENSLSIEINNKKIKLVPIENYKLRIFIDEKQYDAIKTNGLPPDSENTRDKPMTSSDEYLFYSSSSGTRTQNGDIQIKDYSEQFWPLDKFAISTDDLDRLTKSEIEIILNEAFARHGYEFKDEKWSDFFSKFSWYKPDKSFNESEFTKLEKQNVDTITQYEHDKGWI